MKLWQLLRNSVNKFIDDDCPTLAASIAFYSLFSLPPLMTLVVWLAGLVLQPEAIQGRLERQLTELTGPAGAEQIRGLLQSVSQSKPNWVSRTAGTLILLFGASGAIGQLQLALNRIWNSPSEQDSNSLVVMVVRRILTMGLILAFGLVLLLSLFINALLTIAGHRLREVSRGDTIELILWLSHSLISVFVLFLIFGCLFRFLPARRIAWRDIALGSVVTAILFNVGNSFLGWYLASQDLGSAYGPAGSLAGMLVWIYYSTMIFLFGAELTAMTATQRVQRLQKGLFEPVPVSGQQT